MRVSVCVTVFNEEDNIARLIDSLINQTKKPDEIVIIDGGSTDKTSEILGDMAKKQKLLNVHKIRSTRSEGRNVAVNLAKYDIVAMTDAGCIAKTNWLEKLTKPLKNKTVDISAGFYDMIGDLAIQKAFSVFLGVLPDDFNDDFLPSTRSIAFRKNVWRGIGGFSEALAGTAEDTVFNNRSVQKGFKFARVKSARVGWGMPTNLLSGTKKMFNYARGDAKSGIWIHASKNFMSHNIRIIYKILRYLLALALFFASFYVSYIFVLLVLLIFFYFVWSFYKVYKRTLSFEAGMWGIVLQILSDIAGISGFASGLLQ